jgi:hypothetical protein
MKPISVTLALGKETKGTYRYENNETDAIISTLYVRKEAFENGNPPKMIRLAVEPGNQG